MLSPLGGTVKLKKADGATPLYSAMQHGHTATIRILLKHGADVNKAKNDGVAPIMGAVCLKHSDIVKLLLEHQADVYKAVAGKLNSLDLIKQYCPKNLYILEQAQKEVGNELKNSKLADHNSYDSLDLSNPLIKEIDNHDEL